MPDPHQYGAAFRTGRDPLWRAASAAAEHDASFAAFVGRIQESCDLAARGVPDLYAPAEGPAVSSEDVLAAVRGMDDNRRAELADLLGIPRPRHPFLWLPGDTGPAAPLFPRG